MGFSEGLFVLPAILVARITDAVLTAEASRLGYRAALPILACLIVRPWFCNLRNLRDRFIRIPVGIGSGNGTRACQDKPGNQKMDFLHTILF